MRAVCDISDNPSADGMCWLAHGYTELRRRYASSEDRCLHSLTISKHGKRDRIKTSGVSLNGDIVDKWF